MKPSSWYLCTSRATQVPTLCWAQACQFPCPHPSHVQVTREGDLTPKPTALPTEVAPLARPPVAACSSMHPSELGGNQSWKPPQAPRERPMQGHSQSSVNGLLMGALSK